MANVLEEIYQTGDGVDYKPGMMVYEISFDYSSGHPYITPVDTSRYEEMCFIHIKEGTVWIVGKNEPTHTRKGKRKKPKWSKLFLISEVFATENGAKKQLIKFLEDEIESTKDEIKCIQAEIDADEN